MSPATPTRPRGKEVRLTRVKPLRLREVTSPLSAVAAARRRLAARPSALASANHARTPTARLPHS